jgi:hypothetical protein
MPDNPYQSPSDAEPPPSPIAAGEPVRFSGRLTREDYANIARMYGGTPKWARWLYYLGVPLGLLVFGANVYRRLQVQTPMEFLESISPRTYLTVAAAVAVLLSFFVGWFLLSRKWQAMCDRQEGPYATQTFEVGESGVYVKAPNTESRIQWNGFSKCKQNDDYLALHLKPEGIGAINVAKRWFDNSQQWTHLCQYVRERIKEDNP